MSKGLLRLVVSFASVDRLSGSLRGIAGLAQSGSQRLAGMKREARDLERELKDVRREYSGASGNVTALIDKERALEGRIAAVNRQMAEQVRLLKIENMTGRMRARGEALTSAGMGNVAGGAGILAGIGMVARGGADFQSGMTDIALKADLSRQATAGLQNNILAAARAAKALPEDLRAGVDVLAGFGMTPQAATAMIAPIGKVATAYRAEIDDLAAASFANFSNLKVPVAASARALEIMAAAGNAGAFEIKDMAKYFPSLTAQAQAFGQSGVAAVADLAAAAQIARKGTGDSAAAATNLQNLLAKINTEETQKKFAKFGIDLPAALKKAYAEGKTPLEAIADLSNKALGGDLSRLSFLFGDMQAQQALRPLIQNMDEYRKIRADALASKGAVDAAFARRSEDAATQARALTGNFQRLAIVLGPVLLPPLVALTGHLVTLSDKVAAFAQANPGLTRSIVMLVGGLGLFKLGLGAVQLVLGGMLGPLATVLGFLLRNGPLFMTALGGIRGAFMLLARGVMTAGAMMLANPVVAVIVGIVAALGAAGYMIWRHWDKIKAAFMAGLSFFVGLHVRFFQIGGQMMQGLVDGISARIAAIRSLITGIAGKVTDWFKGVLGIRSPSRVFMALGGHIAGGLALGIAQGQTAAVRAAEGMADKVAAVRAGPVLGGRGGASAGGIGGAGGGAALSGGAGAISITIKAAPGQSAQEIAREVERILRQRDDAAGAARRSAYRDDE